MTSVIQPSERPVEARAAGPRGTPVVVALDLGTTSAKCVAVDPQLRVWASTAHAYPLYVPHPGWAEQDPEIVADMALRGLDQVVTAAREYGADVKGVSVSSAMHSILAVDERYTPLTRALTYADSRADDEAAALRATPAAQAVYERTGVPTHPMSPMLKIRWFGEHQPDIARQAVRWISLKEYLLRRLGTDVVVDHSVASGTAMFDLHDRQWAPQALEIAGITAEQLSPLVSPTALLDAPNLDVPIIAGGGDGALANLGAGAVTPATAALSIGTSGAVRVVSQSIMTDAEQRLFCNVLTDDRWVLGGAISNGGIMLRWLRDRLFSRDGMEHITYETLTDLAEGVPPGCEGLLWLPYLTAERAPRWDPSPRGAMLGLDLRHGPGHVIRAGMEGVSMQLRWVLEAMNESRCDVTSVRVTGGFTSSRAWVQILADVLGRELKLPDEKEGSSLGAAMLGMVALGLFDSIEEAGAQVPEGRAISPNPDAVAVYDEVYSAFRHAQPVLGPAMDVLTRLREASDAANTNAID